MATTTVISSSIYSKFLAYRIIGTEADDLLIGDKGNDYIDGGSGNDTLYGGPGQDTILGGSGDDVIKAGGGGGSAYGGDGNDFIQVTMKNGNNHIVGGSGADMFEFYFSDSLQVTHSVVMDFEIGVDGFRFINSDGSDTAIDRYIQTGAGVRVYTEFGDTVDFRGVTVADVDAWLASGQQSVADTLFDQGFWGV